MLGLIKHIYNYFTGKHKEELEKDSKFNKDWEERNRIIKQAYNEIVNGDRKKGVVKLKDIAKSWYDSFEKSKDKSQKNIAYVEATNYVSLCNVLLSLDPSIKSNGNGSSVSLDKIIKEDTSLSQKDADSGKVFNNNIYNIIDGKKIREVIETEVSERKKLTLEEKTIMGERNTSYDKDPLILDEKDGVYQETEDLSKDTDRYSDLDDVPNKLNENFDEEKREFELLEKELLENGMEDILEDNVRETKEDPSTYKKKTDIKKEEEYKDPLQRELEKKKWEPTNQANIDFSDIIGMHGLKDYVKNKMIDPYKDPELAKKYNIKPGGAVLMLGPPGTGKTYFAYAVANELNAELHLFNEGNLKKSGAGKTEEHIDSFFDQIDPDKKYIVLFDEADSTLDTRQRSVQPIVNHFLKKMGDPTFKDNYSNIFFIYCSNRPWRIRDALLRPGRCDHKVYVGLPDRETRKDFFKHILQKKYSGSLSENINYELLAQKTRDYNASDISNVCKITGEDCFNLSMKNDYDVKITTDKLLDTISKTEPSIRTNGDYDMKKLKEFISSSDNVFDCYSKPKNKSTDYIKKPEPPLDDKIKTDLMGEKDDGFDDVQKFFDMADNDYAKNNISKLDYKEPLVE